MGAPAGGAKENIEIQEEQINCFQREALLSPRKRIMNQIGIPTPPLSQHFALSAK